MSETQAQTEEIPSYLSRSKKKLSEYQKARAIRLKRKLHKINYYFFYFCWIGLAFSLYSYKVEIAKGKDATYRPFCDIGPPISCTKVFNSIYGKAFGILRDDSVFFVRNSFFGIWFYGFVSCMATMNSPLANYLSVIPVFFSTFISLYYNASLYKYTSNCCPIAICTGLVNLMNSFFAYRKFRVSEKLDKIFGNGGWRPYLDSEVLKLKAQ